MPTFEATRYVPANAGHQAWDHAYQQILALLSGVCSDPGEDIDWSVVPDGGGQTITGRVHIPEPRGPSE